MDPSYVLGIDSSRPSPPPRPSSSSEPSKRGSSISLEDAAWVSNDHHRDSPSDLTPAVHDSAKSPLLLLHPQELGFTTEPREVSPEGGCPCLPSEPSTPSTPSVTNRMDVYLREEDRHEMRMVGLPIVMPGESTFQSRHSSPKKSLGQSLSDGSSWQIIDKYGEDQASPSRPISRPDKEPPIDETPTSPRPTTPQDNTFERMTTLIGITPESNQSAWNKFPNSPDSGISDLSLSAGAPAKRHRESIDAEQAGDGDPRQLVARYILI
ncbi:hypothetical protein EDB80DRAFT_86414 [Ilyonectria destructans]|nr:hypothetical protein EDB80DRAFT_86414 [Ilyonectria destructans]